MNAVLSFTDKACACFSGSKKLCCVIAKPHSVPPHNHTSPLFNKARFFYNIMCLIFAVEFLLCSISCFRIAFSFSGKLAINAACSSFIICSNWCFGAGESSCLHSGHAIFTFFISLSFSFTVHTVNFFQITRAESQCVVIYNSINAR